MNPCGVEVGDDPGHRLVRRRFQMNPCGVEVVIDDPPSGLRRSFQMNPCGVEVWSEIDSLPMRRTVSDEPSWGRSDRPQSTQSKADLLQTNPSGVEVTRCGTAFSGSVGFRRTQVWGQSGGENTVDVQLVELQTNPFVEPKPAARQDTSWN